ncbi:hypothetical protein [Halothiobacillus diazotrophicus]|uniref:hypothetical protein n=1 Tax=Halothiobacillus diazotrophicus TaxID=1860122 RepID=UPI0012E8BD6C|nr:hypothetical protein [Halothiobacillus diazotrophicus]
MEQPIEKYLPPQVIRSAFGFFGNSHYRAFTEACSQKLAEVVDAETHLIALKPEEKWKDQGSNRHVRFAGQIVRKNEEGTVGGEIVWLSRLKSFRGYFWSNLNPKSDAELFSEAKRLFHMQRYSEYLALSGYLATAYSGNRVFQRMNTIARQRT